MTAPTPELAEAARRIAFLEERIDFLTDRIEEKRVALRATTDRLKAVQHMHHEREWRPLDGTYIGGTYCNHCRRPWPCSTYQAATADTHEKAEHDD